MGNETLSCDFQEVKGESQKTVKVKSCERGIYKSTER